jgi:orotidine 5'-phosphate decarboxylase subfamily 1
MTLLRTELSYSERAKLCLNPTGKALLTLMDKKKSNLALAADVTSKKALLYLAETVGPELCILKTHIDIIEDFDQDLVVQLQKLAEKHNFLLFEDRKFADIGNTVKLQYQKGIYKISDWAHITNAHPLPGPGIIEGLRDVGLPLGRGLLLLAELSSKGSLATGSYTQKAIDYAKEYRDFVFGFICQHKLLEDPSFVHLTPGVSLAKSGDKLGQQYNNPDTVIRNNGADVIIVGRSIIEANHPQKEARLYRDIAWEAYSEG